MRRLTLILAVAVLTALAAACDGDSKDTDPVAFRHQSLYAQLSDCAEKFVMVQGDWKEDFGDSAFYAPAFFAHAGTSENNQAFLDRARVAYERNLTVINEEDVLTGDTNEIAMAALGLVEYIDATGDPSKLPELDLLIEEKINFLVQTFGYYLAPSLVPGYAMETYGPTSINGLMALLSLQRAQVLGGEEITPRLVAFAEQVTAKIGENSWNGTHYEFQDGVERPGLFLYPNITMIIVNARLYQLTQKQQYRDRALAIYEGIQPLKVTEARGWIGVGRYRSPYSQISMGAQTDNYTTLSSSNYTMFALMLLHLITGEDRYLEEINPILDFIEDFLVGESCLKDFYSDPCDPVCEGGQVCVTDSCLADVCHCGVLHHWMDGKIAVPEDPEFFCDGCNHQLLYLMWYRQNKLERP